jgi:hypothetical protein
MVLRACCSAVGCARTRECMCEWVDCIHGKQCVCAHLTVKRAVQIGCARTRVCMCEWVDCMQHLQHGFTHRTTLSRHACVPTEPLFPGTHAYPPNHSFQARMRTCLVQAHFQSTVMQSSRVNAALCKLASCMQWSGSNGFATVAPTPQLGHAVTLAMQWSGATPLGTCMRT